MIALFKNLLPGKLCYLCTPFIVFDKDLENIGSAALCLWFWGWMTLLIFLSQRVHWCSGQSWWNCRDYIANKIILIKICTYLVIELNFDALDWLSYLGYVVDFLLLFFYYWLGQICYDGCSYFYTWKFWSSMLTGYL